MIKYIVSHDLICYFCYYNNYKVKAIEKAREEAEREYSPTAQIVKEREKKRKEDGISEHILLKVIPQELRGAYSNEEVMRKDRMYRNFYCVGRGMEYSFAEYSFHEVVVGYLTRKRLPGKKKTTWSKKPYFYTGFVGPVVWDPKVEDRKFYVVKFLDGDIRRIPVNELEKYLVRVPLLGIFDILHKNCSR